MEKVQRSSLYEGVEPQANGGRKMRHPEMDEQMICTRLETECLEQPEFIELRL